jgi:hypothetical protein
LNYWTRDNEEVGWEMGKIITERLRRSITGSRSLGDAINLLKMLREEELDKQVCSQGTGVQNIKHNFNLGVQPQWRFLS